jgi:hypothetical protein
VGESQEHNMQTMRLCITLFLTLPVVVHSAPVDTLHDKYRQEGAANFSAVHGERLWRRVHETQAGGEKRSCGSCHGNDLGQAGKHTKTGKRIEPMAPSVNAKRLTDTAKIEKWLRRNCTWTLGRVCTPQEKGDFLRFLQQQ